MLLLCLSCDFLEDPTGELWLPLSDSGKRLCLDKTPKLFLTHLACPFHSAEAILIKVRSEPHIAVSQGQPSASSTVIDIVILLKAQQSDGFQVTSLLAHLWPHWLFLLSPLLILLISMSFSCRKVPSIFPHPFSDLVPSHSFKYPI